VSLFGSHGVDGLRTPRPATDGIWRIIHKCLANVLDQRYQAVTELIEEVEGLEAPPVPATE